MISISHPPKGKTLNPLYPFSHDSFYFVLLVVDPIFSVCRRNIILKSRFLDYPFEIGPQFFTSFDQFWVSILENGYWRKPNPSVFRRLGLRVLLIVSTSLRLLIWLTSRGSFSSVFNHALKNIFLGTDILPLSNSF